MKATITRTQQIQVQVSKVVELNRFPMTETQDFNRKYLRIDGGDSIRFKSICQNPNNKRVYFVTLFEEDLKLLKQWLNGEIIKIRDMDHNQFAVYEYQLK